MFLLIWWSYQFRGHNRVLELLIFTSSDMVKPFVIGLTDFLVWCSALSEILSFDVFVKLILGQWFLKDNMPTAKMLIDTVVNIFAINNLYCAYNL